MSKVSVTRGAGKLSLLSKLWKTLDTQFKDHILENQNCLFQLLSIIDEEPDMMTSFMDSLFDGEYYDSARQVFVFGPHALGLTLEDVLYITGLPIQGKPVLYSNAFDDGAFLRVFGRFERKTTLPLKEIMNIAVDKDNVENYQTRKIVVLLIVLFAFIAPNHNKHEIDSVSVQFVENLDQIDEYAWGNSIIGLSIQWNKPLQRKQKDILMEIFGFSLLFS